MTERDLTDRGSDRDSAWHRLRGKVLFLGGPARYASVKIRCLQIAHALGCAARTDAASLDTVPPGIRLVVCVKPGLTDAELERLADRCRLLWDVHDALPPPLPANARLLCSTEHARGYLRATIGREAEVVPHHHANLDGTPNPWRAHRRACWIGRPRWVPEQLPPTVEAIDSKPLDAAGLLAAYRGTDVAYNFRSSRPDTALHLALNPGLKALNAMGYGLPSVSPPEPAYRELAAGGTMLCDRAEDAAAALERLLTDDDVYSTWRRRAIAAGQPFHIERIAARYRALLRRLDDEWTIP